MKCRRCDNEAATRSGLCDQCGVRCRCGGCGRDFYVSRARQLCSACVRAMGRKRVHDDRGHTQDDIESVLRVIHDKSIRPVGIDDAMAIARGDACGIPVMMDEMETEFASWGYRVRSGVGVPRRIQSSRRSISSAGLS